VRQFLLPPKPMSSTAVAISLKEVVLWFLLAQDDDLSKALLHGSGRSDVFRKAPPANSGGRSCLEIAGLDEIRSGAPIFLSDRLVSEGALRSSAGCYHHVT
jgi:hypothetical protein